MNGFNIGHIYNKPEVLASLTPIVHSNTPEKSCSARDTCTYDRLRVFAAAVRE